ncbi:MAG: hypothetical protein WCH43_06660 [Verrucomicrobiota bacterium]
MPKLCDLILTGASGKKYTLEAYPLSTTFKALGGIYAISKRILNQDKTGTHTVLYVGQTGDLSARFNDHHKEDCWTRNSANCISILLEGTEARRLAIESDLVNAINPPCNG